MCKMAVIVTFATATALALTQPATARSHHYRTHHHSVRSGDPRPAAWCGWWMRHHLGVDDLRGNVARWWAGFGSRAHGPAIGVLVVWPHHVGIITGRSESGWIVKSGNDAHAVRERERSLRGVIAFRYPHQNYAQATEGPTF